MNVEGRVVHLVQRLEVTVQLVGFAVLENAFQNVLEDGQLVGVVGQAELARSISLAGADDVIHRDQGRFAGHVQDRGLDVSRVAALWVIKRG